MNKVTNILKLSALLVLIATIGGCTGGTDLDRKQAEKLLQETRYPVEVIKRFEIVRKAYSTETFEKYQNLINESKVISLSVKQIKPRLHRKPYKKLTLEPNDVGQLLVRGEIYSNKYGPQHMPVVIYTVDVGEVTGIAFQNQEKTSALVEYTEIYTPTPYRALYEDTDDGKPKYSTENRSAMFKLYDDGWRTVDSLQSLQLAEKEDRAPPPEGFSYQEVEEKLKSQ